MPSGNTVQLTFAGDSTSLERTFANVGGSATKMAGDLDSAAGKTKAFGSSVDTMNDKVGNSESKFMGTADLLDGLGGAFGLPLEGATNMARSFADLAGGLSSVVGPAIAKIAGMLGIQTAATAATATATGTATAAQWSLNAALAANPIGAVVVAVGLLVGAFVLAWKNSETFRNVVKGAFEVVKGAAEGLWNFFKELPDKLWGIADKIKDVLIWPYKTAFNLIAKLWNNTVGKLSFEIPSWVPGMGGKGFSMPKLPEFHRGGVVPGAPGTEVPIMAMAGETITPAGGAGGRAYQIVVNALDATTAAQAVVRAIDAFEARNGPRFARA